MTRKIDKLPQVQLVIELRAAVDGARVTHPLRGAPASARRRVRRLIRENPHSILSSHVQHQIGRARREWLEPLIRMELG